MSKSKVDYNDGKWHLWGRTDSCPPGLHPQTRIDQVWHDPQTGGAGVNLARQVQGCAWGQTLKFRVTEVHREPREFWVFHGHAFESLYWAEQYRYDHENDQEIIHVREVM